MTRLLIIAVVLAVVVGATAWHRRRSEADATRGATGLGALPAELLGAAPATWVIFTTPYCASCTAVQTDLGEAFPHHEVRKIDATERIDLADRYEVKRAPTTLLADERGNIVQRLVGAEAVRDFIGAIDDPALVD